MGKNSEASVMKKPPKIRRFFLLRVAVYELGACFRVHDLLTAVKAEVAREHVRYAAGKREVQQLARAEQLDRQDDRRYRAVHSSAEHRDERDRRRELRRYAKQRPDRAAEDRLR